MEKRKNWYKVGLRDETVKRISKGYPLIRQEDLLNSSKEWVGQKKWAIFTDSRGQYIATGYLGRQNKGAGWVLSRCEATQIDTTYFRNAFLQARERRAAFFAREDTNAFRLFNGEGDGIGGITVDFYENFLVLSWYNETILDCKCEIIQALQEVFPETKGIYEKYRFKTNEQVESRHLWGETAPEPLLILENNVVYAVYLDEGLMTGIFLDQKEVRESLISGGAAGLSVLNTFSYTGAFSVAAAMGGAVATTSVDLAKRSLKKTQEQFLVNGLDLEKQKIFVMDIFEFFRYAIRKGLSYDMIILDPPSFARNKKQVFSVAKNYHQLVEQAIQILRPGGRLITSTNAASLTNQQFKQLVQKGIQNAGAKGKLLQEYHLPADFRVAPDFPEGDYLKVYDYEIYN